jgi:hypothetical protein
MRRFDLMCKKRACEANHNVINKVSLGLNLAASASVTKFDIVSVTIAHSSAVDLHRRPVRTECLLPALVNAGACSSSRMLPGPETATARTRFHHERRSRP